MTIVPMFVSMVAVVVPAGALLSPVAGGWPAMLALLELPQDAATIAATTSASVMMTLRTKIPPVSEAA
jgi:hypothetical protein